MPDLFPDFRQFDASEYAVMFIICTLGSIALLMISDDNPVAVVAFPASLVGAYVSNVVFGALFDTDLMPGRIESVVITSAIGMTVALLSVFITCRHRSNR